MRKVRKTQASGSIRVERCGQGGHRRCRMRGFQDRAGHGDACSPNAMLSPRKGWFLQRGENSAVLKSKNPNTRGQMESANVEIHFFLRRSSAPTEGCAK